MDNPKWEWMDSIFGMIVGGITTIFGMLGWINPRFSNLQKELDEKIGGVHARITDNDKAIAELEAHHSDKMRRLESIERKIDGISGLLLELRLKGKE